jgi:hypothetical protein
VRPSAGRQARVGKQVECVQLPGLPGC